MLFYKDTWGSCGSLRAGIQKAFRKSLQMTKNQSQNLFLFPFCCSLDICSVYLSCVHQLSFFLFLSFFSFIFSATLTPKMKGWWLLCIPHILIFSSQSPSWFRCSTLACWINLEMQYSVVQTWMLVATPIVKTLKKYECE